MVSSQVCVRVNWRRIDTRACKKKQTKHEEDVDDDKKAMFRLHIVRSADEQIDPSQKRKDYLMETHRNGPEWPDFLFFGHLVSNHEVEQIKDGGVNEVIDWKEVG